MNKLKLALFAFVLCASAASAQCTTPAGSNPGYVAGGMVLLETTTTPPTALDIFVLHSDCTATEVGNPNVVASWTVPAVGNLQLSITSATYSGNTPLTLTTMTISFYVGGGGYSVGNFLYPAPVQTTVNFTTGAITAVTLDPYGAEGGPAYQLVSLPKGI